MWRSATGGDRARQQRAQPLERVGLQQVEAGIHSDRFRRSLTSRRALCLVAPVERLADAFAQAIAGRFRQAGRPAHP